MMNRRSPRILFPFYLLTALLVGACSEEEENHPPTIQSLTAERDTVLVPAINVFNGRVTLTGSATDVDGDSLFWQWTCSRGEFPEGSTGSTVVWLAPPVGGDYEIHVRVEDGHAAAQDALRIIVIDLAEPPGFPQPVARFTMNPPAGDTDTQFKFDATSSSGGPGGPARLEVRWDWGADGVWDTQWSVRKTMAHRFGLVGFHKVRLEVRDSSGQSAQVNSTLIVDSALPTTPIGTITLPPGEFMMGSGDGHLVVISQTFEMGRTEVTNAQFLEALNWADDEGLVTFDGEYVAQHNKRLLWIAKAEPTHTEIRYSTATDRFYLAVPNFQNGNAGPGVAYPQGYDPANHPVKYVSWYGAACCCDWLSAMNGLPQYYDGNWLRQDVAGEGYRLPLPEEWEYAARFLHGGDFPWGDTTPECALAEFNPGTPCTGWTAPVGSHPEGASALGFQDLAGNVQEWVNSIDVEIGYSGDTYWMQARGGHYASAGNGLQTTLQVEFHYWFESVDATRGFRVCHTLP